MAQDADPLKADTLPYRIRFNIPTKRSDKAYQQVLLPDTMWRSRMLKVNGGGMLIEINKP